MNIAIIRNASLFSIYCSVPEYSIDNNEFAKSVFEEDLSSTINALGVQKRHICKNRETTSLVLATDSAKRMFEDLEYDKSKIGALIFVTLTPDCLMPNNASAAHEILGLDANCAAFDVNHACSGYIYGLWLSSLICSNLQKDVLLLDADTNSYYTSERDKSTGLLFGDAGSASLIKYDEQALPLQFCFFTDAKKRDALTIPGFGFKYPLTEDSLKYKLFPDGGTRRFIDMYMDGESVFNYVVSKVPKQVRAFFDEIEMEPEEYMGLLLHQANAFMLRQMARKIGFETDKVPFSIQEFGNTSSVSIPLTITFQNYNYHFSGLYLMVGMGAGLSTGIVSIDLSSLQKLNLFYGDY
ncbi:MAG: ketoacyl-ACP synthase III [Candidatus Cloacimonas sp.]|nr:ketoacyl-ACP synthase III [Candidatus Cloacimonas sp.]